MATTQNTPVTVDAVALAAAGVPPVTPPKARKAFDVLLSAHQEAPAVGGLSAKAAWDTLGAFAERIGAPFPVAYRDAVLRAAAISSVKQRGGTRTGRLSLSDAWKSAIAHSEADGLKDEDMRGARKWFDRVARIHAAFGNAEEV